MHCKVSCNKHSMPSLFLLVLVLLFLLVIFSFSSRVFTGWSFFLSGSPSIQNWSPDLKKIGYSFSWVTKQTPKPPPTYLGLGLNVLNLQVLRIGDIPGMSISSIMPFHNHVSVLVHWLSQGQQNWPRGLMFAE